MPCVCGCGLCDSCVCDVCRQAIIRIQGGGASVLETIQNESDEVSLELTMLLRYTVY